MRAFLTLLAGAFVLAIWIYALIDCIRAEEYRVRGVPKIVWIMLIILLPLVGSILWLVIGRDRESSAPAAAAPKRPLYPDDDPAFLNRVERDTEREERIRRLEERLAELDDDTPDTPDGSG